MGHIFAEGLNRGTFPFLQPEYRRALWLRRGAQLVPKEGDWDRQASTGRKPRPPNWFPETFQSQETQSRPSGVEDKEKLQHKGKQNSMLILNQDLGGEGAKAEAMTRQAHSQSSSFQTPASQAVHRVRLVLTLGGETRH